MILMADMAADVAARGGRRLLAGVGAVRARTAGSAYSLIALHDRVLVARGRRALQRTHRPAHAHPPPGGRRPGGRARRIERDLHDGAQARLVALTLQLGRAEMRAADQPEVRRLIHDAQREARLAIAELRDLARGIVPPLLADRGLVAAVESLAARYGLGSTVAAETSRQLAPGGARAPPTSSIAEALTNTAKHASRAAQLGPPPRTATARCVVLVGDDGLGGADPQRLGARRPACPCRGARRQRWSSTVPPAHGTVLEVALPCG